MRYFFIMLLGALLLSSCSEKEKSVAVSSFNNGEPKQLKYYVIKNGDTIFTKFQEYHPNGALFIEGKYKNDERHGQWKSWRENGIIWSEQTYDEGKASGPNIVYYENGNLFYKGLLQEDKRVGIWEFYLDDGSFYKKVDYSNPDVLNPPNRSDSMQEALPVKEIDFSVKNH